MYTLSRRRRHYCRTREKSTSLTRASHINGNNNNNNNNINIIMFYAITKVYLAGFVVVVFFFLPFIFLHFHPLRAKYPEIMRSCWLLLLFKALYIYNALNIYIYTNICLRVWTRHTCIILYMLLYRLLLYEHFTCDTAAAGS